MEEEKILNAFPLSIRNDVKTVLSTITTDKNFLSSFKKKSQPEILIHPTERSFFLNKELIRIPIRIYFDEPDFNKEKQLNDIQRTILNCIYLKHYNGFIRQKRLEKLTDQSNFFIIPFTIQLLGECVVEIIQVLEQHINSQNLVSYVEFIHENPTYWNRTESRIVSYWNVYYRARFPLLKDYPGQQIARKINEALRK